MRRKLFMFLTPDGITFSSPEEPFPDVENLQVLGWAEGTDEDEAFNTFFKNNPWVNETSFEEIICVEIKTPLHKCRRFFIKRTFRSAPRSS